MCSSDLYHPASNPRPLSIQVMSWSGVAATVVVIGRHSLFNPTATVFWRYVLRRMFKLVRSMFNERLMFMFEPCADETLISAGFPG